jgi:hypothetical protein
MNEMEIEYLNGKWWRTFDGYPPYEITEEGAMKSVEKYTVIDFTEEPDYKYYRIVT